MAAGAPRQIMNEWTTRPEEILETFAAEMRANLRHYSIHPGNYALIIPKQLREHLQAAKWSKTDIDTTPSIWLFGNVPFIAKTEKGKSMEHLPITFRFGLNP